MNERIKQLALQAGATTMERSGWTDYGTLELDVEKFAKLIIEECVVIALDSNASGEGGVIAKTIEEQFGVE